MSVSVLETGGSSNVLLLFRADHGLSLLENHDMEDRSAVDFICVHVWGHSRLTRGSASFVVSASWRVKKLATRL